MKLPTIKRIIIQIAITVAVVELFIMVVLQFTNLHQYPVYEVLFDVLILTLLSTPIIFIWIIKPFVRAYNKAISQISEMANFDPLTKLANRRLLFDYLETELNEPNKKPQYGALLFVDLDGFKNINDEFGHDAGDHILIGVANTLTEVVRPQDIASRIGGDEFVVALCNLDIDKELALDKAMAISKRIHDKLLRPQQFNQHILKINSSIGVKLLTPEDKSVAENIKAADKAMYQAKKAGKGRITLAPLDLASPPSQETISRL